MAGEGVIGLDGINGSRTIVKYPDANDTRHPAHPTKTATCGTAKYVCDNGPPYSMWNLKIKPCTNQSLKGAEWHSCVPGQKPGLPFPHDTTASFYPYGPQGDEYSYENGAHGEALTLFSPGQLPIKTAVAQHFAVFNNLYGAVPSFSEPNHLMFSSATSCHMATNPTSTCKMTSFPQATIYDSLDSSGVSFGMYSNTTGGDCPEPYMEGVMRHKENCHNHTAFYADAAAGTLPAFSFLSPPGEACDHRKLAIPFRFGRSRAILLKPASALQPATMSPRVSASTKMSTKPCGPAPAGRTRCFSSLMTTVAAFMITSSRRTRAWQLTSRRATP